MFLNRLHRFWRTSTDVWEGFTQHQNTEQLPVRLHQTCRAAVSWESEANIWLWLQRSKPKRRLRSVMSWWKLNWTSSIDNNTLTHSKSEWHVRSEHHRLELWSLPSWWSSQTSRKSKKDLLWVTLNCRFWVTIVINVSLSWLYIASKRWNRADMIQCWASRS